MRIAMMSLWNAANGPSIHAELIGRSWVELGNELIVFSATEHPDARPTRQKDEDYVIRHFSVKSFVPFTRAEYFNPDPILKNDFDVFVAQNVERLPMERLLEIWLEIKRKSKTIMVVHEGKDPEDPLYYKFDWDKIVCFDNRYKNFISKYWDTKKIVEIPYPYAPFKPGDKKKSRQELGYSLEEKIIFSFGFRASEVLKPLPALEKLSDKYNLRYLVILNPESDWKIVEEQRDKYKFIDLKIKPLTIDEVYNYLYASDALLIHREDNKKYPAVISSTVCQVLGAGCPIVFHNSNYVETYGEEIIKYENLDDLVDKLEKLFTKGFDINIIKKFLEKNNCFEIAKKYIKVFNELLKEG